MAAAAPRQRVGVPTAAVPSPSLATKVVPGNEGPGSAAHPSGKEKHGRLTQLLRSLSFGFYFTASCLAWVPIPISYR